MPDKPRRRRGKHANNEPDHKAEEEEAKAVSNDILGVVVHQTEALEMTSLVSHPVVEVILVDLTTGLRIAKPESSLAVTSFYDKDSRVPPLMTQPCDFNKSRMQVGVYITGI